MLCPTYHEQIYDIDYSIYDLQFLDSDMPMINVYKHGAGRRKKIRRGRTFFIFRFVLLGIRE